MLPDLTEETALKALQEFFQLKPFVLFGTGTSCAVDKDFGMKGLKKYLSIHIPKYDLKTEQKQQWENVVEKLNNDIDFEVAMNDVQDKELIRIIVDETAKLVVSLDQKYSLDIMVGKRIWPAQMLFKRLVDNLPETDRTLHVATTNYDLLAEYAFEQAGIPYTSGFAGGICRYLDWEQARRCMTYTEKNFVRNKIKTTTKIKKHIELYKVHGSLNTFMVNDKIVENNVWVKKPENFARVMITPGMSKYEEIHTYRNELLTKYDKSLMKHSAFLFLGFGFNDNHLLNAAMKQQLKNYPSLIINMDSNTRINELIKECENAWLLYKSGNGTGIYNSRFRKELIIEDKCLWNPEEFVKEILGG
ncbi:SIR2 family protein [Syntrophomonas wolfei]|jgi:hypothetical protein|uniref:Uncharacterized protein n=1 Tax=Syntrophomonas wolfei TaxID=863 RepID=A0A354YXF3_9FIRM|nr:SIR2 family protein [Syntrophomonas wolfei]HBK54035.1 hypothetical protein [Syntrophomonas wolfei]